MTTIIRKPHAPRGYRSGARFDAGATWSPGEYRFPRKVTKHPATKVVNGAPAPAAPAPAPRRRPKTLDTQGFNDPRIIEMLRFELSQEGIAERFISEHGLFARYCHEWGQWLVWTGQRWQIDRKKSIIGLSSQTIRKLKKEAKSLHDEVVENNPYPKIPDERVLEILTKLVKHASSFERLTEREGMLSFASSLEDVPIEPAELDAHPMLLNCRNGVVDLKTGTLIPHADSRGYFLTKQAKIAYDHRAECPRWERFLDEVFGGNTELISYIRRCAGYWLSGEVSEKAIWFFYGNGNNGKTTLLKILREALGLKEYAGIVDINTLMKKTSDDYSLRMTAMLQGMRFVTASEASEGCVLNEALIKHLTGMDDLVGRHIYGKTFEFPATHKIIVDANHRPTIRGTDDAIWLRLHLVPFEVMFSDDPVHRDAGARPMDKNLWRDLRAELPGILAWAVRGALEWQHDGGLRPPRAVIEAVRAYRAEQDVFGRFLEQCCMRDPKAMVRPSDLYDAFQAWCTEHGVENPHKQPWLTKKVKEKKFTTIHKDNGDFFVGLRLRSGIAWETEVPVAPGAAV